MKKNKMAVGIICFFLFFFFSNANASEKEQEILEDFKTVIVPQDEDSYMYDKVLKAVGKYVEEPDNNHLEKAVKCMQETLEQFEQREKESENLSYEMDRDFAELLVQYHINPEEYQMNADVRLIYLQSYEQSVSLLLYILEQKEQNKDVDAMIEILYRQNTTVQDCMRKSRFYEINYFFCDWEEEQVKLLQETILSQLKSFTQQGQPWEQDKKVIENKILVYTEQLQDIIDELSEQIGEKQEQLYRIEQEKR